MSPRYAQVARRAGHRCEYCHAPEAIFNFPFEVEHILPLAREGVDEEHNWALSCRSCNLHKFTHVDGIDPKSRRKTRLFHPRKDIWKRHFSVNEENGQIEGLTAVGRATVIRLEMNSPSQVAARQQWMVLGIFP